MILFRIRNAAHEYLGEHPEKEVIRLIRTGVFSGEEEYAVFPFRKWHKLATHARFYDILLKQIHKEGYGIEETSQENRPLGTRKSLTIPKATRVESTQTENGKKDDASVHGESKQLPATVADPAATIHQSLIEELFSEVSQNNDAGKREESPVLEVPNKELGGIVTDIRLPGTEPVAATPETLTPNPETRRKKILIAALIAGLALLFFMGDGDKPQRVADFQVPQIPAVYVNEELESNANGRKDRVNSFLREGEAYLRYDGDMFVRGAQEIFSQALLLEDKNAKLLGRVSVTGAKSLFGRFPSQEKQIRGWIESGRLLDPQLDLFYQAEALIELSHDRLEEARNFAQYAIDANATNLENFLVLAEIQVAKKEYDDAKTLLTKIVRQVPQYVRAQVLLAELCEKGEDYNCARTAAMDALRGNPFNPRAYLILAEVALRQNQIREAKSLFEASARLGRFAPPNTVAQAFYRLGSVEELLDLSALAGESFSLAKHFDTSVAEDIDEKVKDVELSPERFEELLAATLFDQGYLNLQAEGLYREGKVLEAIKFWEASQLLDPSDAAVLVRLGEALDKKAASFEDFVQIMNIYERALIRNPEYVPAYTRLGTLETDQYNFRRGYELLRRAVTLGPDSVEPYVALGKHFFKRRQYNESLTEFLEAAKRSPRDDEILYYAGLLKVLFRKDSAKEAMKFFYQAYEVNPRHYRALAEWLKLKVQFHEKPFAVKFLRSLLENEPNNPKLHWVFGEIYASNAEHRRAIEHFHRALDLDNRDSEIRMSLGRSLENQGDLVSAVAEFRLASLLDPRNGDGFYKAASILFLDKNYDQAEIVLKELLKTTPNYPGVHRELANVYRAKRNSELALQEMEREVKNNPQNVKFITELAQFYMEYGRFEDAVKGLSEVVNQTAPEFVYDRIRGYLLLSRAYRAMGRLEGAESSIKLAIALDASDPELHQELGYVYRDMQRDVEAVQEFQVYLDRNPTAEDVEEIKKLIKQLQIEQ